MYFLLYMKRLVLLPPKLSKKCCIKAIFPLIRHVYKGVNMRNMVELLCGQFFQAQMFWKFKLNTFCFLVKA